MKTPYLIVVIILILNASCTSVVKKKVKNQPKTELENLEKAIDDFNKAFEICDIDKLKSLLAEDYIHTNGNTQAFKKERWLKYLEKRKEQIRSKQLIINDYQFQDKEITIYAEAAILTGKIIVIGVQDNLTFKREIRITNLWIKENGQWKRAGFHDTKIQ